MTSSLADTVMFSFLTLKFRFDVGEIFAGFWVSKLLGGIEVHGLVADDEAAGDKH